MLTKIGLNIEHCITHRVKNCFYHEQTEIDQVNFRTRVSLIHASSSLQMARSLEFPQAPQKSF
jgi:hypothetical protein